MKAKAKDHVKVRGGQVSEVIRGFYFERFAARVFHSDPDGWLIKGGQALLVRYPAQARMSRDMDLQRRASETVEEALAALHRAAALDLGDHIRYTPDRLEQHSDEISGAKQWFQIYLGTKKVDRISVDLVTGRMPTSEPETTRLTPAISVPWPDDWPVVRLYPLPDHVADKICAIFE
jgi:hypothetical protein